MRYICEKLKHTKMKRVILSLFLGVILFAGCKPTEVIRYVDKWHETTKIDTINTIQKDSIVIRSNGDTVFVEKYKTMFKDRVKILNKNDSIFKTDTIVKNVQLPAKEIIKYKWGLFDWLGLGVLLYFIGFIALKILKAYKVF